MPHLVRSMVHKTDPVDLADLRSLGQSYSLVRFPCPRRMAELGSRIEDARV